MGDVLAAPQKPQKFTVSAFRCIIFVMYWFITTVPVAFYGAFSLRNCRLRDSAVAFLELGK